MLKAVVENLESVEEAHRDFYVKIEDDKHRLNGKFVLKVTPVDGWGIENPDDLKTALSSERQRREANDKLVRDFAGLDPADVRKKLEKLDKLSQFDPEKESDKLAKEKIENIRTQLQQAHEAELRKRAEREQHLFGALRESLITAEAKGALAKHGGDIDILLPHVEKRARLKEADTGQFFVEVLDGKGLPRIKDASGALFTLDDLVAEMKTSDSFGKVFVGSGTTGSDTRQSTRPAVNGTSNPWKRETRNLTEQMRLERADPATAKRMKSEAGVPA